MKRTVKKALSLAALLWFLLPACAAAEVSVILYIGKQFTGDGELRLRKGETDLTFSGVRWDEESFRNPVFYGIRTSYWFDRAPQWGVGVDFTHAKTYLRQDDTVPVRGTRKGTEVDGRERISDSIRHFGLSHGLNMLTFNGLHRWFAGPADRDATGGVQLEAGVGAGFSIPHVEADVEGHRTGRYQFPAGPVLNGMLGINYDLSRYLSGIAEYKLSWADVGAELEGGGSIEARTLNHQLVTGISGNLDRR